MPHRSQHQHWLATMHTTPFMCTCKSATQQYHANLSLPTYLDPEVRHPQPILQPDGGLPPQLLPDQCIVRVAATHTFRAGDMLDGLGHLIKVHHHLHHSIHADLQQPTRARQSFLPVCKSTSWSAASQQGFRRNSSFHAPTATGVPCPASPFRCCPG